MPYPVATITLPLRDGRAVRPVWWWCTVPEAARGRAGITAALEDERTPIQTVVASIAAIGSNGDLAGAVWRRPAAVTRCGSSCAGPQENHIDYAQRLAAGGMWALVPDLRGPGDTGGHPDAGMPGDLLAALDHLTARGAGPLGVRGSSMGGLPAQGATSHHGARRGVHLPGHTRLAGPPAGVRLAALAAIARRRVPRRWRGARILARQGRRDRALGPHVPSVRGPLTSPSTCAS